jgi:uncharacterized protein
MTAMFSNKIKLIFRWIVVGWLCSASVHADPWGKDADLVHPVSPVKSSPTPSSFLARWGIQAIRFHQEVISPADGPRSHFIPSSSQYTLEAMQTYGFFSGFLMGCDRLMRENDERWIYRTVRHEAGHWMKSDPIPILLRK